MAKSYHVKMPQYSIIRVTRPFSCIKTVTHVNSRDMSAHRNLFNVKIVLILLLHI